MSYIRLGIINKGKKNIIDIHGSNLYLDIDKTIKEIPYMESSNIFKERKEQSLSEIRTENIDKFVKMLENKHIKGGAKYERGERTPSCVLNANEKELSCIKNHWYSDYSKTIPDDWKFKIETRKSLKEIMK